jgi:3-hydroxyacyl-CoA dehydrogenase
VPTSLATVRVERIDDVVVLTLDGPPVNLLGRAMRRALLHELDAVAAQPDVVGIVIAGSPTFSAGADLAEFDSGEGLAEPTLHLTITGALDELRVPSVAAISGAALGGGLELALACSARVAHPDARLGLPESTLGFMPGAGGTQRLPRAIGIEPALDLIVTGRAIDAATALRLGLVSEVADDPVAAAIALCLRLAGSGSPKPRLRDLAIDEPLAEPFVDTARRAAARNPRTSPGVLAALDALRSAVTRPFDAGLADELALFERLAASPQARAARYRFQSEHSAGRLSSGAAPLTVGSAAVIGAGTMGRGIALALLGAGIPVVLIDTADDRVEAARIAVHDALERLVERDRITPAQRDERAAAFRAEVGIDSAADAALVIEAVFENLDVKREVFAQLDAIARQDAILASNTSSLDLDAIAAATTHPERVVGMHFFSPADVMRLVEVVDGGRTSDQTLATAVGLVKRLRKVPVVAQVGPGFIGNRIFDQYLRQAQLLLRTGASPERIDRALEAWGMAMGPFRVLDMVGNDVPAMARAAAGSADSAFAIADELAAKGWLGRKTGTGWYSYTGETPVPNTELHIEAGDPAVNDDELVQRCVLAMVREAASVLDDGIAASRADIDTVMVTGYGFPADRGGPWFDAEQRGWDRVLRAMRRWHETTGDAFWAVPASLAERDAA